MEDTMKGRAGIAATVALLAAPMPAAAQDERATYEDHFTTRAPGAPTGWWFRIEHRDPANPEGKPPEVVSNRIELPAGTRIDTGALPACEATDDELMAQGRSACPPESHLGDGTAEVITGFGTPVDPFGIDVSFYNAPHGIVTVARQRGSEQTLSIERSYLEGTTFTSESPPPPGGPPDGRSAIREVIWDIPPHGGWMTTPPTCPRSGRWTTTVTFGYQDGQSATAVSQQPCDRPRVQLSVERLTRQGCVRRRLVVRATRAPANARLRARVDGRRARATRRGTTLRLATAALRPGRHRLAVRATAPGMRPAVARMRFRRC
jgi:hypothetical protein